MRFPDLRVAIKAFSKSSDFKPEADRAAGAVESAEEDLKDLKKINQQVTRNRFCIWSSRTLAMHALYFVLEMNRHASQPDMPT